ncbi:hypothetical protein EH243_07920 [Amphritea opalescens]|uniref:Uncharacterized protein n=1 Tax=Amphritea opalescens TaxID=2490544 RepID=A0A430KT73_9GAMM|nr:hypothetical protein [Amphritea opalescens]RTE66513.1 hypothetical protein EH243_07920 [Amphritea opalescens]
MGFSLIWFYLQLLLPEWMRNIHPDSDHFYRRKLTPAYKDRLRYAYRIWLGSVLLMIALPSPPVIIGLGLFTTFLSFSLLDEH